MPDTAKVTENATETEAEAGKAGTVSEAAKPRWSLAALAAEWKAISPLNKILIVVSVVVSMLGLAGWNISSLMSDDPTTAELMEIDALRHKQLLAEVARENGVNPKHLLPLFQAAERELPEEGFEQAIRAAVDALIARANAAVPDFQDDAVVEAVLREARERLKVLDTEGAIAVLEEKLAESAEARAAERLGEARLARELAAIAAETFQWEKAILAHESAGTLNPADAWAWFHAGDIHKLRGDLGKALAAYEQGGETAEDIDSERDLSVSYNRIGNVERARGDLDAARKAYQDSLEIERRRPTPPTPGGSAIWSVTTRSAMSPLWMPPARPIRTAWRSGSGWRQPTPPTPCGSATCPSVNKIGDVETARGDLDAALKAYQDSLEIGAAGGGRPRQHRRQRDLSVSYNRGSAMSRPRGAIWMPPARPIRTAWRSLAATDANTGWQRDLSVSNKIGDVERARGDLDAARKAYQDSLEIRERLAAADPANTEWQRDLAKKWGTSRSRGAIWLLLSQPIPTVWKLLNGWLPRSCKCALAAHIDGLASWRRPATTRRRAMARR